MKRSLLAAMCAATAAFATNARAEEAPLPEPILSETVTDIDGDEAGEYELELNAASFRARRGGAYELQTSIEFEWLVTRHLGIRLEPAFGRTRLGPSAPTNEVGGSAGLSWKLLQNYAKSFHLQAEVLGRLPWEETAAVQPGDPASPLAIDLRAAYRVGALTLRGSVGLGLGGDMEHGPIRASLGVLFPFEASGRFGFWGVETDIDGDRQNPFLVALNIVPDFTPLGLPFRFGLAVPWSIAARDHEPSLGVLVRLFYVSAREMQFGKGASSKSPGKASPREDD